MSWFENKLIVSFVLVIAGLVLRWFVVWHFRKLPNDEEGSAKRWINSAKNAIHFLMVVGLILIWLSELRFLALSIATFIVALVMATREFIQCFIGSIYLASARLFAVGDWIRIGSSQGEVVGSDWVCTTILEIDLDTLSYDYTGRTLIIPNNHFIANAMQNLNYMKRFIAHSFTITRDASEFNPFTIKEQILTNAKTYCEEFAEQAKRYSQLMEARVGVNLLGPEPSIRITTSNLGKNQFTVTVYCPTPNAVEIEQKLLNDYMRMECQFLEEIEAAKQEQKLELKQERMDKKGDR